MAALGLTWKAQARSLDDTRVELRVGRLTATRRGGDTDAATRAPRWHSFLPGMIR